MDQQYSLHSSWVYLVTLNCWSMGTHIHGSLNACMLSHFFQWRDPRHVCNLCIHRACLFSQINGEALPWGWGEEEAWYQARDGLQWSQIYIPIQNLDVVFLLLPCIKNAQISYHVYIMVNIQNLMGVDLQIWTLITLDTFWECLKIHDTLLDIIWSPFQTL